VKAASAEESGAPNGFALVAVLWACIILAMMAGAVLSAARSGAVAAHLSLRHAKLVCAADSGIAQTILQLASPVSGKRPRIDGRPDRFQIDGYTFFVSVQDEGGKVDLNAATPESLLRLMLAAGADSDLAHAETDRILDWREPGDLRRLQGAKRDEYRQAGYRYGPRGAAFKTVGELRLVMGMSQELYDAVADAVTVYSGSAQVDATVAPKLALLSIAGMNVAQAEAIIASRSGTPPLSVQGTALTVAAWADEQGLHVSRSEVILISGDPSLPIWIYRRSE